MQPILLEIFIFKLLFQAETEDSCPKFNLVKNRIGNKWLYLVLDKVCKIMSYFLGLLGRFLRLKARVGDRMFHY